MDKRFFLAILLTGVILLITPVLFPVARPTASAPATAAGDASAPTSATTGSAAAAPTAATIGPITATPQPTDSVVRPPIRTIRLANTIARYDLSSGGAALLSAELPAYQKLGGGTGPVQLAAPDGALLRYRLLAGGDTIRFDALPFTAVESQDAGRPRVTFTAPVGTGTLSVTYTLSDTNYLATVDVRAAG
ncbi:MAG: YidC/Oxa1 family insertase periplasmic-domain containing protein, partial [Gemmatimonadota bacterium]